MPVTSSPQRAVVAGRRGPIAGQQHISGAVRFDEPQLLSVSDDDLQQEMARARRQLGGRGGGGGAAEGRGGGASPARQPQRPNSAVPLRSNASPRQQVPTANGAGGATPRQALVVPPRPTGVVAGRTPSKARQPTTSSPAAAASSGVIGTPSRQVGSSSSAPPRVLGGGVGSQAVIARANPQPSQSGGAGKSPASPTNSNANARPAAKAPVATTGKAPSAQPQPLRAALRERPRLPPPPQYDDSPPRRMLDTDGLDLTPGARQQHQWMEVLNYVDAVTIAITHRAKVAPPIAEGVGEAWGETLAPGASPRDAFVGGGVPLSLGGIGPSARSARSLGLKAMYDLQRAVGGVLHWFSLLELRHMPEGTSIADAERNLALLGEDVRRYLASVQQALLEAAARRGSQSLAFVKAQSLPSFEDCEHTLARLLSSGRGLAAVRSIVARRDAEAARGVIADYKRRLAAEMAAAGGAGGTARGGNGGASRTIGTGATTLSSRPTTLGAATKASPSKFQQKRAIPTSSSPAKGAKESSPSSPRGTGNGTASASASAAALRAVFDPSLPTYPPTLIEWLERQWLPAVEGWGGIVAAAAEVFSSPLATRESIARHVEAAQSDVAARQLVFSEMLRPGETMAKLVQSMIVVPGAAAAKAAGRREEAFEALQRAVSKANFVELASRLKEIRDGFDESALGEAEVAAVREGQRLLLAMQHVAKVTMGLTQALGGAAASSAGGGSSAVKSSDVRQLLKALTAANQTLLDLRLASDAAQCEAAVAAGCKLLVGLDRLTAGDDGSNSNKDAAIGGGGGGGGGGGTKAEESLSFYRSVSAADLVVAHVPSGAWPPELTLLYQRAAAALGTAAEREVARSDLRRHVQRHLLPAVGSAGATRAPSSSAAAAPAAATPGRRPTPNGVPSPAAGTQRRVMRSGSTSTDLGIGVGGGALAKRSASPAVVGPAEGRGGEEGYDGTNPRGLSSASSQRSAAGMSTVAVEDLRALLSRGRQLGLGDGRDLQQLQRVLESATELRLKIHFDSNIRVLGLPMERRGGQDEGEGPPQRRAPSPSVQRGNSSAHVSGGAKAHYEPPTFDTAFDRIYRFCTGAPPASSPSSSASPLHSPRTARFRIRYQDADGDFITVAGEEDWRVLLSDHYRGALLSIGNTNGATTAKSAAQRRIELFCDVPPVPQQQLQQQSTAAGQAPTCPVDGTAAPTSDAHTTPFRGAALSNAFIPTTAVKHGGTPPAPAKGTAGPTDDAAGIGGVRGRNVSGAGRSSPSLSVSAAAAGGRSASPAAGANPNAKRGGFTVQHTNGRRAVNGGTPQQSNLPPPPPPRQRAPVVGSPVGANANAISTVNTFSSVARNENDALNAHMRRERLAEMAAAAAGGGEVPAMVAGNGEEEDAVPLPPSTPPRRARPPPIAAAVGIGVGSAHLRPTKNTDDDGTLSVIDVNEAVGGCGEAPAVGGVAGVAVGGGGGGWADGDDAFDVRTMQSVATTAIVEGARRAHAPRPTPIAKPSKGNARVVNASPAPAKGAAGLSGIGDLPARQRSTTGARGSAPASPHVVRAAGGQQRGGTEEDALQQQQQQPSPLTWQEAHGDDYDVRTIMSEATTVANVRALQQQQQGGRPPQTWEGAHGDDFEVRTMVSEATVMSNTRLQQQQPLGGVSGAVRHRSPAARGAGAAPPQQSLAAKRPLTNAEVNQRRAALLAQLRQQRPSDSGNAEGLVVGNNPKR